jgi:diguanylate cyclase (GGDEF)-like protein
MILAAGDNITINKLLFIGPNSALIDQLEKTLPAADVAAEPDLLTGLITLSNEPFDLAVIQVPRNTDDLTAALPNFRRVRKSARILLLCEMLDEPVALGMTQRRLADDYLILPLDSRELQSALRRFCPAVTPSKAQPTIRIPEMRSMPNIGELRLENIEDPRMIVRELGELIDAANRGLSELLERICWSAMFVFDARGAKLTWNAAEVIVGQSGPAYGNTIVLSADGETLGKLELATDVPLANAGFVSYLEQLVPGLIRLATSHGELQEMANTDPLTGLANRRYLDEVLNHLVERARNERFRVTLVLFDFDNFKHYNDAFGHGAGDEILREAGMLIKRCIRRQDFAARYGGDEIAVVLWDWQRRRMPNSEHPRSAMAIMERFRKLLKQHHFTRLGPQVQGSLTISGGLASFPWDAASGEELIERADQALLEAKRSGKDRIYLVGQSAEKIEDTENQRH